MYCSFLSEKKNKIPLSVTLILNVVCFIIHHETVNSCQLSPHGAQGLKWREMFSGNKERNVRI